MSKSLESFDFILKEVGAIDYEITHQLILKRLLEDPVFATQFSGITTNVKKVVAEPFRGCFDLGVHFADGKELLIEMKMWSPLQVKQIKRQTELLKENANRMGVYFLLGTSNYEYLPEDILKHTDNLSYKISYEEIIRTLDYYRENANSSSLRDLSEAYRNALHWQNELLCNAWQNREKVNRRFYYYSFYRAMQKLMPEIRTKISTWNQGVEDYFIQADELRREFGLSNVEGKMFMEIKNEVISIHFENEMSDRDTIRKIFLFLKGYFESQLSSKYPEISAGRGISKWMKIAQMPIDFQRVGVEGAVEIFRNWFKAVEEFQP